MLMIALGARQATALDLGDLAETVCNESMSVNQSFNQYVKIQKSNERTHIELANEAVEVVVLEVLREDILAEFVRIVNVE